MNRHENIVNACKVVTAHGYAVPENVKQAVVDLDNPHYRVAVVGKFQVGKSTLINKVFLGNRHLLAEGRGLCTTALSTDIEYGDKRTLEVYRWKDETRTEEVLEKSLVDPSPEDVNTATVSNSMTTRAELAKKVSRVKITEPNEALKGYTIIDTPGLDDPNAELLAHTTFRIIPKSDVALLVIECRAFDTLEKDLLRNSLIGQGLSHFMVLVSYKPNLDMDKEQRDNIKKTIQAELASIDRNEIPVELYCYDSSLDDILCDVSEIRLTIGSYLEQNALPGREERVAYIVRQMLHEQLLKIATEIKLADASKAKKDAFKAKIDDEEKKFRRESEQIFSVISNHIKVIEEDTTRISRLKVDEVFSDFCDELENAENIPALQHRLKNANTTLRVKLTEKMPEVGLKMREKMTDLLKQQEVDINKIFFSRELFVQDELGIQTPLAAKIPPIIYTIIDVGLFDVALPGGVIIATIGKLLFHSLFHKVNISQWIGKKLILSQVNKSLDEPKNQIKEQLKEQIHNSLQQVFEEIKQTLEENNRQQLDAIRAGADADDGTDKHAALKSAKEDIEQALKTLGAE